MIFQRRGKRKQYYTTLWSAHALVSNLATCEPLIPSNTNKKGHVGYG